MELRRSCSNPSVCKRCHLRMVILIICQFCFTFRIDHSFFVSFVTVGNYMCYCVQYLLHQNIWVFSFKLNWYMRMIGKVSRESSHKYQSSNCKQWPINNNIKKSYCVPDLRPTNPWRSILPCCHWECFAISLWSRVDVPVSCLCSLVVLCYCVYDTVPIANKGGWE